MLRTTRIPSCLLACLFTLSAAAQADGISWQTDYGRAAEQARDKNRLVLVFVTSDGCRYCTQMKRSTWSDEQVTSVVGESFVPLVVNASSTPGWLRGFNVRAYPTTLVLSVGAKIEEVDRVVGYVPPSRFYQRLTTALRKQTATARRP